MKVTDEDRKMLRALTHLVDNGSFSLKGREAIAFGAVVQWLKKLEERFQSGTKSGK